MTIKINEQLKFFLAMYGKSDEGILTIWTLEDKKTLQYPLKKLEEAINKAIELGKSKSVYYGIGLRRKGIAPNSRGGNKDVVSIPCMWLDIDINDGVHSAGNNPTMEQAQIWLDTFPLQPSAIIHSGGGLHVYWLLDFPASISNDKEYKEVSALITNFQQVFKNMAHAQGLNVDSTNDLARVLRVPGTFNYKDKDNVKEVQILKLDNDVRYSFEEIKKEVTPLVATPQEGNFTHTLDFGETISDANPIPIIQGCKFISNYLEHKETASYDEWMAALRIGAFCEGYEELCHEWSKGHPNYSREEVDQKIKEIRSNMKPPKCEWLKSNFKSCEGCENLNKVNSPIALGMKKVEVQVTEEHLTYGGYFSMNNFLYQRVFKRGGEEEKFISRHFPRVTKQFTDIETNEGWCEIVWNDRGKMKKVTTPAKTLAAKKDVLELSNLWLDVNETNHKDIIKFFKYYLLMNKDIKYIDMVSRLGHVKNIFVHPSLIQDIQIIPTEAGEKQLIESFQLSGTVESWKNEVFERIKDSPKALFVTVASFASITLADLGVSPFIIDLSGTTSQGKTTTLKIAASVWGTGGLVNEWNATKVSLERKSAFINSFPVFMDDTRKADIRQLGHNIYLFSGGRGKGRAKIKGSESEATWNNILISTGEVSLNEYAKNEGGAAARIIPLIDSPLKNDYENILMIEEGIKNNHGVIGLEFLKIWLDERNELSKEFNNFRRLYIDKVKGQNVLTRLAGYYAVVHFVGSILNKKFNLNINLKAFAELFEDIAGTNGDIDKPRYFFESILTDLDSDRQSIYYEEMPTRHFKATYRNGQLCLMVSYLNDFLGIESNQVRTEWARRGFVHAEKNENGKWLDYKLRSHKGMKNRTVALNMEKVSELGFDFNLEKASTLGNVVGFER